MSLASSSPPRQSPPKSPHSHAHALSCCCFRGEAEQRQQGGRQLPHQTPLPTASVLKPCRTASHRPFPPPPAGKLVLTAYCHWTFIKVGSSKLLPTEHGPMLVPVPRPARAVSPFSSVDLGKVSFLTGRWTLLTPLIPLIPPFLTLSINELPFATAFSQG